MGDLDQEIDGGLDFGSAFRWGVATASYQIEGATTQGGRGSSVWDTFCAEPGRIKDGDTGEVACDHYHRYAEDVALMRDLGVDAYRFSFAWPRIQPTGQGPANREGLAFYDRLVDSLLEAGIAPCPTLFHWDTPQALQDRGGWLERDIAARFADYASILGEHFADRIDMWATVNEPMVVTLYGHALGMHAPGLALMYDALPVAHHLLLAHGNAVRALRAAGAEQIGIVNNHAPTWPASDTPGDVEAATAYDDLVNWTFADPVLLGHYPESMAALMPEPVGDDLQVISTPLDWYGLNHYFPASIAAAPEGSALPFDLRLLEGYPMTDFGWPVVPDAFRELVATLTSRYGDALPPVYVTENGCSYADGPGADGRVPDRRRVEFLDGYLRALRQAIDDGADVRGYFLWSLLDNFEWAEGYSQRFGIVHVDFATQRRTPKDSFTWFREVIAANRADG
jgi:beta-glucosidase